MAVVDYHAEIRTHAETIAAVMEKRITGFMRDLLNDDTKRSIANHYRKHVEKYVPMELGHLRKSAHISSNKYKGDYQVVYGNRNVKYAKVQYVGYNGRGAIRDHSTAGTYDHWNKHMSTTDRATFYDDVAEELRKRIKNG